jgi:hypothetical protein
MAPTHFNCDSCSQTIQPSNPRIHCLDCPDHDICANCALGERFVNGHSSSHATQLFRMSGGGSQLPLISGVASIVYVSSGGPPAPPTQYAPPSFPEAQVGISQGGTSHGGPFSSSISYGASNAQYPSTSWGAFFNLDMSPTPTLTGMMDAIFTALDPSRSGYLTPEVFSRFQDDLGYPTSENICKSTQRYAPFHADLLYFRREITPHPNAGTNHGRRRGPCSQEGL